MRRTPLPNPGQAPALIVPDGVASLTAGAAAWPAVNRAVFVRFALHARGVLRYVNFIVGTANGSIQYGLVALSGSDHTTFTRVAHSGVIACPSAGNIHGDFGATDLPAGDYAAFLWADNTTFQTRVSSNSALTAYRLCGIASSLATGVPASGTLAWDPSYVVVTLGGDV